MEAHVSLADYQREDGTSYCVSLQLTRSEGSQKKISISNDVSTHKPNVQVIALCFSNRRNPVRRAE